MQEKSLDRDDSDTWRCCRVPCSWPTQVDSELLGSQNKVSSAVDNNHTIVKNKPAIQEEQHFSWNFLSYNSQEALWNVRDNVLTITLQNNRSFLGALFRMSFKVRKEGHRSRCH